MSIAAAAQGAGKALEEIIGEQLLRAQMAQRAQEQAAQLALQTRQVEGVEQDRASNRAAQRDLVTLSQRKFESEQAQDATDRNVGLDASNVLAMPGMDNAAKAQELTSSVLRNPNAKSATAMMKTVEGLTKVPPAKSFTPPQRLADGSIAQFENGQIPAGTKFFQEPNSTSQDVTDLSPEGLDMAALNYLNSGAMPPLGMGDRTTRKTIIDRAARLTPEDIERVESGGMDVAGNTSVTRADRASLAAIQKQRDALGAFESTALKNLDVFLAAAAKIPDTGVPWMNQPIRSLANGAVGSPEVAAYEAARRTVIPEFAKILANPGLSGQLSDSARHEIDDVIAGNATYRQMISVASILKQDTANRRQAYDDAIAEIKGRGRTTKPENAPGSGDAAAAATPYEQYLAKKKGGG